MAQMRKSMKKTAEVWTGRPMDAKLQAMNDADFTTGYDKSQKKPRGIGGLLAGTSMRVAYEREKKRRAGLSSVAPPTSDGKLG